MQRAARDFDFLLGHWQTTQRRLKARLQGCTEWDSFSAASHVQHLPGGVLNFDTLVAEDWRPGWVGQSIRIYNPVTDLWSIYWVTNEGGGLDPATGWLAPPVVGRFEGDEGVFEGEDRHDGRPVRVRYRWQRLGPDAAHWEQAFSADGGQHWETNWEMHFSRQAAASVDEQRTLPAPSAEPALVELRRYTLHPRRRETLVELFDRHFVDAQEAEGLSVMGQFRDLDDAGRFVWLRGHADPARRATALAAFYDGPVWQRHRAAANATMIDSGDVLLLHPAWPGAGLPMAGRRRPAGAVRMALPGLVDLAVWPLRQPATAGLRQFCRDVMQPCLQRAGVLEQGWYVSAHVANDFPRHPVREDLEALVGVAVFRDAAAFDAFARGGHWAREVMPGLAQWLAGPVQAHRLVPTARSALHA